MRVCSPRHSLTCPEQSAIELNLCSICGDAEDFRDVLPRSAQLPKIEQVSGSLAHISEDLLQEQFIFELGSPIRIVCALKRIQFLKRAHILNGRLPRGESVEPVRRRPKHVFVQIADTLPESRMPINERGKRMDCNLQLLSRSRRVLSLAFGIRGDAPPVPVCGFQKLAIDCLTRSIVGLNPQSWLARSFACHWTKATIRLSSKLASPRAEKISFSPPIHKKAGNRQNLTQSFALLPKRNLLLWPATRLGYPPKDNASKNGSFYYLPLIEQHRKRSNACEPWCAIGRGRSFQHREA